MELEKKQERREKEGLSDYLISVIDINGKVKRRLILGEDFYREGDRNSFSNWLKNYCPILESKECIFIENYDFFEQMEIPGFITLIEVLNLRLNLFVFGAGHVGMAVGLLGTIVGYKTLVLDDREDFLMKAQELSIGVIKIDFTDLNLNLPTNSAVVIVTRGHQFDELCLKYVLNFGLKYIGMIGSQRRVSAIFKRLENQGIYNDIANKVCSPIGLKIGARTPVEIAVSIIAEIIEIVNK
jgi:hypothetical protein